MRNIFRNAGFEVFTAVLLNILVTDVSKGLNAFIFRLKESKIKFVTVWYVKWYCPQEKCNLIHFQSGCCRETTFVRNGRLPPPLHSNLIWLNSCFFLFFFFLCLSACYGIVGFWYFRWIVLQWFTCIKAMCNIYNCYWNQIDETRQSDVWARRTLECWNTRMFCKNCVLVRATGDRRQGHSIHIEAHLKYGLPQESWNVTFGICRLFHLAWTVTLLDITCLQFSDNLLYGQAKRESVL